MPKALPTRPPDPGMAHMTALSGRRVAATGNDYTPNPVVTRSTCRWCSQPIWQSLDLADDDRWYDLRPRAGTCTGIGSADGAHAPTLEVANR